MNSAKLRAADFGSIEQRQVARRANKQTDGAKEASKGEEIARGPLPSSRAVEPLKMLSSRPFLRLLSVCCGPLLALTGSPLAGPDQTSSEMASTESQHCRCWVRNQLGAQNETEENKAAARSGNNESAGWSWWQWVAFCYWTRSESVLLLIEPLPCWSDLSRQPTEPTRPSQPPVIKPKPRPRPDLGLSMTGRKLEAR